MNLALPFQKQVRIPLDAWIRSMLPESDRNANLLAGSCGIFALLLGYQASKMEFPQMSITPSLDTGEVKIVTHFSPSPPIPKLVKPQVVKPEKTKVADTKATPKVKTEQVASQQSGPSGSRGGSGGQARGQGNSDRQSRGVLAVLSAMSKGLSADVNQLINAKLMTDLDKTMDKFVGVRKTGTSEYAGRRGKSTGFNEGVAAGGRGKGWGSGIGDGIGGKSGDGFGSTIGGGNGSLNTRTKVSTALIAPQAMDIEFMDEGSGRSKPSVMRIVQQRSPGLRHIFSKFARSGFAGGVLSLRFTIAPSGEVISLNIARTATGNSAFDQEIMDKVKQWNFGAAPNSGNTQVTIPLTFSE